MLKTQAIADLAMMLTAVTSTDRARIAIQQALTTTGLAQAQTLDQTDMLRLLTALAAEGGVIEQLARSIAIQGLGDDASLDIAASTDDPTDRSAA
jgi:hypothetical protein